MELTVDQALQQGVVAHRDGKLQEAENYYRAILNSQPQQPDANYNLGVLVFDIGDVEQALLHFKIAAEWIWKESKSVMVRFISGN